MGASGSRLTNKNIKDKLGLEISGDAEVLSCSDTRIASVKSVRCTDLDNDGDFTWGNGDSSATGYIEIWLYDETEETVRLNLRGPSDSNCVTTTYGGGNDYLDRSGYNGQYKHPLFVWNYFEVDFVRTSSVDLTTLGVTPGCVESAPLELASSTDELLTTFDIPSTFASDMMHVQAHLTTNQAGANDLRLYLGRSLTELPGPSSSSNIASFASTTRTRFSHVSIAAAISGTYNLRVQPPTNADSNFQDSSVVVTICMERDTNLLVSTPITGRCLAPNEIDYFYVNFNSGYDEIDLTVTQDVSAWNGNAGSTHLTVLQYPTVSNNVVPGDRPLTSTVTPLGAPTSAGEYIAQYVEVDSADFVYVAIFANPVAITADGNWVDQDDTVCYSVKIEVTINAPTLSSITPLTAATAGGSLITINGNAFSTTVSENTVYFDGVALVNSQVNVVSPSEIRFLLPEGDGTSKSIRVNTNDADSNALSSFSYSVPVITSIVQPSDSSTAGGFEITLRGSNFGLSTSGATVTVGPYACIVKTVGYTHTQVTCTMPVGMGRNLPVSITVNGQSPLVSQIFSYDAPVITSYTQSANNYPTSGNVLITVIGKNFGTTGSVVIGGNPCDSTTSSQWQQTQIICNLPAGTGTQTMIVTVAEQSSNFQVFAYDDAVISSFTPTSDGTTGGTTMTITGSNFGNVASAITVQVYEDIPSSDIISVDHTQIKCRIPAGEGANLDVKVKVGDSVYAVASTQFSYDAPIITGITPQKVQGSTAGDQITITMSGSGFGTASATINAYVADVPCDIQVYDQDSLECTLPAGSGADQNAYVSVNSQQSGNFDYDYPAPVLSTISHSNGPTSGSEITVTGTDFATTGSITVGGASPQIIASYSGTQVVFTTPVGSGINNAVQISVNGQSAPISKNFDYDAPSITSIENAINYFSTKGGDEFTITGNNFGTFNVGSVAMETHGTLTCDENKWSHTSVACDVPTLFGENLDITVSVDAQASNTETFSYAPPSISSVSGSTFPTDGGVSIFITGSSFDTSGTVTVGGTNCVVTTYTHESIACTLPSGQGANVATVVTTQDNRASGVDSSVSYNIPYLSLVTISDPPLLTNGGSTLSLSGADFGTSFDGDSWVKVDGALCTILTQSSTSVTCTAPAGQGPANDVIIRISGQESEAYPISYENPTITQIDPAGRPTEGGIDITLTGTSFGNLGIETVTVTVGANDCPVKTQTHTKVTCTLPAGTGSAAVYIRVSLLQSQPVAFAYDGPTITQITPNNAPTDGSGEIVIEGENFGTSGVVTIGGEPCTSTSPYTDTSITCTVPPGVGVDLSVTVTSTGSISNSDMTISYDKPSVSSISPANGVTNGGYEITIEGKNFGPGETDAGDVTIDGKACVLSAGAYTDTEIKCTVPEGAGADLQVVVKVANQLSTDVIEFSYDKPVISLVTEIGAAVTGGTKEITLSGTSFGVTGSITIGGRGCTVSTSSNYDHNEIKCNRGPGEGSVNAVIVTVEGQASDANNYAYDPPVLDTGSLYPANAPTDGGSVTVTVRGENFGRDSQGTVYIGATLCPYTLWTHSRVECSVPEGEGKDHDITLTAGNQNDVHDDAFSYDAPIVSSITPANAGTIGGYDLIIDGSNFGTSGASSSVQIGSYGVTITARDHDQITVEADPGIGSSLGVVVTVQGQSSPDSVQFDFDAPILSSLTNTDCIADGITTTFCPTAGGSTLTLTGSNFGPSTGTDLTVIIGLESGDVECPLVGITQSEVTCLLPGGKNYDIPVTLKVGGQTSNVILMSYAYPRLDDDTLSLCDGTLVSSLDFTDINGGQQICFEGKHFGDDTPLVKLGTTSVFDDAEFDCVVDSSSDTTVRCTLQSSSTIVGHDLRILVNEGPPNDQTSFPSSFRINFPQPTIVDGTITLDGGTGATSIVSDRSGIGSGEYIQFIADYVGDDDDTSEALLTIVYGDDANPDLYECGDISVSSYTPGSQRSIIRCRTAQGTGGPYKFKIQALNQWSDVGSDTYKYSTPPTVTDVSGCVVDSGDNTRTINCPTSGFDSAGNQVRLTVTGTDFSTSTAILVGVEACGNSITLSTSEIQCDLPSNVGRDMEIIAVSGSKFSEAMKLLDYADPSITSITGCVDDATSGNTEDCARNGGKLLFFLLCAFVMRLHLLLPSVSNVANLLYDRTVFVITQHFISTLFIVGTTITVVGSDFGLSNALVLVGSDQCLSVTHDATTPHSKLTCTTPSGVFENNLIIMVQDGGQVTGSFRYLSYLQCPLGTYQATSTDYDCTDCLVSKFGRISPSITFVLSSEQFISWICDSPFEYTFSVQNPEANIFYIVYVIIVRLVHLRLPRAVSCAPTVQKATTRHLPKPPRVSYVQVEVTATEVPLFARIVPQEGTCLSTPPMIVWTARRADLATMMGR